MPIRGLRGATTVTTNTAEAIHQATRELLLTLQVANGFELDDVASIFFTTTADLTAEVPAKTARELGWTEVAMMCLAEMETDHGLRRCVRVLIHWNTDKRASDLYHIYLRDAAQLRPDRAAHVSVCPALQDYATSAISTTLGACWPA
jgi:chorismate mutase